MNVSTTNKWTKVTRTSQGNVYGSPMDKDKVSLRADLEFTEKNTKTTAIIAVVSLVTSFLWLPLLVRGAQEILLNPGVQTFAGQLHNFLAVFK